MIYCRNIISALAIATALFLSAPLSAANERATTLMITMLDGESEPYDTMDELLEGCPTDNEIDSILADFNIIFDYTYEPYECIVGDEISDPFLNIVNAFRAMKHLNFSFPLPLIKETNLYDWYKSLELDIHVFKGNRNSFAIGNTINLNSDYLESAQHRNFTTENDFGGTIFTIGLLLHEARHTRPGGGIPHTCGTSKDCHLNDGGAWALQFYYYYWVSEYTDNFISEDDKLRAYVMAANLYFQVFSRR